MQKLVDYFIPNNCRKELKKAAARHECLVNDILSLTARHRSDITQSIKEDRRAVKR